MGDVRVSEDVVTQVVQTAVLRPGDTLIVRVKVDTPRDERESFVEALRERLPDVKAVVIGAEELAVYRPEPLISVQLSPQSTDEAAEAVSEHVQRNAGRQSEQRRRTG